MNRFRELKSRLIKGKRDSQKVQINPSNQPQITHQQPNINLLTNNYDLQQWVQNQLQYYGISPSSYRLRQLKHFFNSRQSEDKLAQDLITQTQGQIQIEQYKNPSSGRISQQQHQQQITQQQHPPIIATTNKQQHRQQQLTELINNLSLEQQQQPIKQPAQSIVNTKNHCSQRQLQGKSRIDNRQPEKQQAGVSNNNTPTSETNTRMVARKNKIICKKSDTHHHAYSLSQLPSQTNPRQVEQDNIPIRDFLLSHQATNQQVKSLDYLTLILQLTVQLNYSRVNKETKNERSILKQLKNLICYVESEEYKHNSGSTASHAKSPVVLLSSQKSCHTFSSIHSNTSLMSIQHQQDFPPNDCCSPNRALKPTTYHPPANHNSQQLSTHSLTANKPYNLNSVNELLSKTSSKWVSSEIDSCILSEQQHNQTFKSISIFEQQNQSSPQRNYNAMGDDANANDDYQQQQQQRNIIRIDQQSENETNIVIENTPLSRITEHQSQYTISCQPSLKDSPSRQSLKFVTNNKSHGQQNQAKHNQQQKQASCRSTHFLPENQLILKKLSHNTQHHQKNPLQQSLQYKRILYMLDSEYNTTSDYKHKTPSRVIISPQSSSLPFNQSSSEKSLSLYYIKNSTDISAKSFNKQLLDSHSQIENNHHTHTQDTFNGVKHRCIMNDLQAIFNKRLSTCDKSPQRLMFNVSGQNTPLQSERFKKHQRSKTSLIQSNQGLSKTKKYRLNLLSQLSQQINEQSGQNAYDVNKYSQSKNQSQDDSVYHKVSRYSYLTSSSPNSKVTSSESQLESGISMIRKENLIVKKNKQKNETFINQKKTGLIVKKSKKRKNQQDDSLNHTQRLSRQNKENFEPSDIESNSFSSQSRQSYSKQSLDISNHHRVHNKSNIQSNFPDIDLPTSSIDQSSLNNRSESRVNEEHPRPIKYKVYNRQHQQQRVVGKQDKRKVLQDIVSILNSKYNKNIQLRE